MLRRVYYLLLLLFMAAGVAAAEVSPTLLELNQAAFFHGREYYVLCSGRAQMLVQADRSDLGPAFTWLLIDAQDAKQSARKGNAFNYVPKEGFGSSALEVVLGGFPFTALGHRTDTRWVVDEGIPAVETVWWAGGVRVAHRTLDDLEGLWDTRWSDGGYDRYHTSGQPDQPGSVAVRHDVHPTQPPSSSAPTQPRESQ